MDITHLIVGFSPLVLLSILLAVLCKVRAYEDFPWFFTYSAFAVCAGLDRYAVRNSGYWYFYSYWITEAGYVVLSLAVLYEVFQDVFRNLAKNWRLRLIFPVVFLFSILLAVGRKHFFLSNMPSALMSYIVTAELAVRLLQVIIFALFLALVYLFGLRWRQYAFGIATGFGVYATVALISTTQFSEFGTTFAFAWGNAVLISYSVAVLIWIWFFARPLVSDNPSRGLDHPFSISSQELERYKKLARRLLWR